MTVNERWFDIYLEMLLLKEAWIRVGWHGTNFLSCQKGFNALYAIEIFVVTLTLCHASTLAAILHILVLVCDYLIFVPNTLV